MRYIYDIGAIMSDGPHKSLPMNSRWRKVAEMADRSSEDIEDVAYVVFRAVEQDWRLEIPDALVRKIRDLEARLDLLVNEKIEDIRKSAGCSPIANFFLDNLLHLSNDNVPLKEAMVRAATLSIIDKTSRCRRQMEEHYLRESGRTRSGRLANRLAEVVKGLGFDAFAKKMLQPDWKPLPRLRKRNGIDDGVRL